MQPPKQQTATRKPTLKRGSKPYLFHIESRSRPGTYHVTDAYRMTCTCEAGKRRRSCWHLHLAVQYYAWRKHMQTKSQPAPAGTPVGMAALQEAFE